jgi:hypothetical protein
MSTKEGCVAAYLVRSLALAGLTFTLAAGAFPASAQASPVGSQNVTVADPSVPTPPGTPCVVQLFANDTFDDFGTRPFSYDPSGCPGPWSKVVLQANFAVTAGVQYDRTANIWLSGVNLFFGTTQEPGSTLAPSWQVERDLTDYSALLSQPGQGQAICGNEVNGTYTGVITGSASLLFYPVTRVAPAAQVANAVYPLGSDPVGSTVSLNSSTDQLAATLTLPTNVTRAYLDVFAQSQNADEFWYTCVPDQYAAETDECGGGNFREVEVSIDGVPAGAAPVYPWVYTGGIDPFLWEPTPGVQTLNFMPYRVDLTPFAGLLSNGQPHTVAMSVQGANDYFSATAALLLFLDPGATQVTGAVTYNELQNMPPTPTIGSTLSTDSSGNVTGAVSTQLSRHYLIRGYANTSQGHVLSSVQATVTFADTQTFNITSSVYSQVTSQVSAAATTSESSIGSTILSEYQDEVRYPFNLSFVETVAADGSATYASTISQKLQKTETHGPSGTTQYSATLSNSVSSADTLAFDASGNFTGNSGTSNTQTYSFDDSAGGCYNASVTSAANVVTGFTTGANCPNQVNHLFWYSHPDGSPDNGDVIPPKGNTAQ